MQQIPTSPHFHNRPLNDGANVTRSIIYILPIRPNHTPNTMHHVRGVQPLRDRQEIGHEPFKSKEMRNIREGNVQWYGIEGDVPCVWNSIQA